MPIFIIKKIPLFLNNIRMSTNNINFDNKNIKKVTFTIKIRKYLI